MKTYQLYFMSGVMAQVQLDRNGMLVYEMDEPVDGALLSGAVRRALDLHPVFKTRLIRKGNHYCLIENECEPVVPEIPWSERVSFGTEEYHEYPWLITYTGSLITFISAHFLTDGMGQNAFMKTVLRFYLESSGVVFHSDEGLLTEDEVKKTCEDGYRSAGGRNSGRKKKRTVPAVPELPDEFYGGADTPNELTQFILRREDVSGISRRSGTSSFSVISALACRAVALAAGLSDGYIKSNTTVDLRVPYKSTTDLLFTYSPDLFYDIAKFRDAGVDAVSGSLRAQLTEAVSRQNLDAYVHQMKLLNGWLRPLVVKLAEKQFAASITEHKAQIIYSHMTHLGFSEELEQHVRRVTLSGTKGHNARILFHVINYKDYIFINLAQNSAHDCIADRFEECLREAGIRYDRETNPGHGRMRYQPPCWRKS